MIKYKKQEDRVDTNSSCLMVQVAMGIIRQPQNTSEWKLMKDYQTMKATKGSGRAIIAITRKIARIVFSMLNNKQAFNPDLMKKAI